MSSDRHREKEEALPFGAHVPSGPAEHRGAQGLAQGLGLDKALWGLCRFWVLEEACSGQAVGGWGLCLVGLLGLMWGDNLKLCGVQCFPQNLPTL